MDNEHGLATGVAGGLIATALLDVLVTKEILTNGEARDVLNNALQALGPFIQTPIGYKASHVITDLMRGRYTERR
jgi:hypothetical protein